MIQKMAEYDHKEIATTVASLSPRSASKLLALLPDSISDSICGHASDDTLAAWIKHASPDDAQSIALRLPIARKQALTSLPGSRIIKSRLNVFGGAGLERMVNVNFVRVGSSATLDDVVNELQANQNRHCSAVYICSDKGLYLGVLDLHRAFTAARHTRALDVSRKIRALPITSSLQQATRVPQWSTHRELPVVDARGRLLGSVSYMDLRKNLETQSPPITSTKARGSAQVFELAIALLAKLSALCFSSRPRSRS